jgi:hypothetical protein
MVASPQSATIRVIAAVAAFFFCFQTSRFFIVASVNSAACPMDFHDTSSATAGHHQDEKALSLSPDQETGSHFQHCKDTANGLALTPVQPLPMPTMVSEQVPVAVWTNIFAESQRAAGLELPPPFQPPRYSNQPNLSQA